MDWQAYIDGSLSASERRKADELLKTDANAQAQLAGLNAFRQAVKEAGRSVDVPIDRLQRMVPPTPSKISFPHRIMWIPPLMAVLLGGWFILRVCTGILRPSPDTMSLAQSPPIAALQTSQMPQATAWITQKTGMTLPPFSLMPEARLMTIHCGRNWATFEFVYHQLPYTLVTSTNTKPLQQGQSFTTPAGTFFKGLGIGWTESGFGFYLKGGKAAAREQLAEWFRRELERKKNVTS